MNSGTTAAALPRFHSHSNLLLHAFTSYITIITPYEAVRSAVLFFHTLSGFSVGFGYVTDMFLFCIFVIHF